MKMRAKPEAGLRSEHRFNPVTGKVPGRRGWVDLASVLVVLAVSLLVLFTPAAGAAPLPELLTQLSPGGSATGSGAGEINYPRSVATSPVNGHVYVGDVNNARIDEFTAWGVFVRSWGWGVDTGAPEFQICTAASTCQAGIIGGGAGQLGGTFQGTLQGVAVDTSGYVYVFDHDNHRVQKFAPDGQFLLAWGGDVVAQGPGNSPTDEQQEIVVAATSGSFKLSFADPFGGGQTATTSSIPFDATAAQVEASLNALATIAGHGGQVSVSGGPGDGTGSAAYVITFEGNLSGMTSRS